jgi:predicted metal-dependent peptidase
MQINENVRQSVLKLLNLSSLRYFGLLVYNFEFHADDPRICPTFQVYYERRHWHIGYNDAFASAKPVPQCIYVIIHEIIHSIAGHIFRKAERVDAFWMLSTDHVININLDRDIDQLKLAEIQKPDDRMIITEIADKFHWSAEQTYDWLYANGKLITKKVIITIPAGGSGGEIGAQSNEPGAQKVELELSAVKITSTGKEYIIWNDMRLSDESEAEAAAAQRDMAAQARVHANTDRSRGTLGSNIRNLLKDIIEIQVPPDRILENAIRTQLQKGDDRSWKIPNKRLMVYDIYIPAEDTMLQLSDVIFLNDHSGSISDTEIKKFSGVMKNCAHLFQRLHIIKHDYHVLREGGITVLDREQLLTSSVLFEAVGRGGTSHKEPFDYCQSQIDKGIPISLIIGLTDWASDIEYVWDRYTFHKEVPVIWVVPNAVTQRDARYGKILHILKGKLK